jgi:molybdopterin synthase catalytic subunit
MINDRDELQWLVISPDPIPIAEAIAFVHDETAGGITTFLGTARGERDASGRQLLALDYEAYEEMAAEQLRKLCAQARTRWPIIRITIVHRLGRVELAEPSVLIAVSTPHRGESFEACRFLIDSLKKDIAIWKKEVWSSGPATWVHPQ